MLSGVSPSPFFDLTASENQPSSAKETNRGADPFSQQMLSILEDSLAKLGASGASVKAVAAQGPATAADAASSSSRACFLAALV